MRIWKALPFLIMLGALGCNKSTNTAPPSASAPVPTIEASSPKPSSDEPTPSKVSAKPSPDAMKKLAASSNAFGFDLYAKVRASEKANIVISPASVSTALAMTWGGAKSKTAEQMKQVMHLDGTPAEVMDASGKLTASLTDKSRPVVFRIANRLFGEKSYQFDANYLSMTERAYGAPLERVNFRTGADKSRTLINAWVEKQTENRIKDLIPPRALDGETRLVLVNAIYFLGDWENPFKKNETRPVPFHLSSTQTSDVAMMNRTGAYKIGSHDGLTALELPYKGGALSMLVLLPDAVDGLDTMEAGMTETKLEAISAALESERVSVSLPKFTIDPTQSLGLKKHLITLGMKAPFDRTDADFTGIANPPNPDDHLFVTEVFHKGFIKVDEKGTEAAAATAVPMGRKGSAFKKARAFKVDHPFSFVIRDNASGLILFMGRVVRPSAA